MLTYFNLNVASS